MNDPLKILSSPNFTDFESISPDTIYFNLTYNNRKTPKFIVTIAFDNSGKVSALYNKLYTKASCIYCILSTIGILIFAAMKSNAFFPTIEQDHAASKHFALPTSFALPNQRPVNGLTDHLQAAFLVAGTKSMPIFCFSFGSGLMNEKSTVPTSSICKDP